MTLARYFLKLCSDAKMTNMHEIARRAHIDPSTPWKIKNGRPVRGITLGKVLRALGYAPKDEEYRHAFALWSAEVMGERSIPVIARAAGIGRARNAGDRELHDLLVKFTAMLRTLPTDQWPLVCAALDKPALIKLAGEAALSR